MLLSVVISINSKNPFRKKVTFSIIEINTKYIDVLHLCFIGCFLRKMRKGYNSDLFVVNIMIDKRNETVWRLNFGHINVTMTRSRETHPFSWKV